mgnify:CR=1 FL=1
MVTATDYQPVRSYSLPRHEDAGFRTLKQVATEGWLTEKKLTKLIKHGALDTYIDVLDRRVRLVRLEDVKRLAEPRPATGMSSGHE